ncbi:hypothetical protein MMF83_00028685 [Klebsiella pneumoniae]
MQSQFVAENGQGNLKDEAPAIVLPDEEILEPIDDADLDDGDQEDETLDDDEIEVDESEGEELEKGRRQEGRGGCRAGRETSCQAKL